MANASLIIVDSPDGQYGLVAGWSLRGRTDADRLIGAWAAAGLPEHMGPSRPSPESCLSRAVAALGRRDLDYRRVKGPTQATWAVSTVGTDATGLPSYQVSFVCTLSDDENTVIVTDPSGRPCVTPESRRVSAEYALARSEISHADLSSWLVGLVSECDGVSVLRENGGVYYIPPTGVEYWHHYLRVIRSCTQHKIGELPAMRSDAAIQTILDGLTAEVHAAATAIQAQLEATVAGAKGGIGERALASREAEVSAIREKLQRYDHVLAAPAVNAYNVIQALERNIRTAAEAVRAYKDGVQLPGDTGDASVNRFKLVALAALDDTPVAQVEPLGPSVGAEAVFAALAAAPRRERRREAEEEDHTANRFAMLELD